MSSKVNFPPLPCSFGISCGSKNAVKFVSAENTYQVQSNVINLESIENNYENVAGPLAKNFNTLNGQFTVCEPGIYEVTYNVTWQAPASGTGGSPLVLGDRVLRMTLFDEQGNLSEEILGQYHSISDQPNLLRDAFDNWSTSQNFHTNKLFNKGESFYLSLYQTNVGSVALNAYVRVNIIYRGPAATCTFVVTEQENPEPWENPVQ